MFLQNCGCFVNNFELSVNASLSQDLICTTKHFMIFFYKKWSRSSYCTKQTIAKMSQTPCFRVTSSGQILSQFNYVFSLTETPNNNIGKLERRRHADNHINSKHSNWERECKIHEWERKKQTNKKETNKQNNKQTNKITNRQIK